MLGLHRITTDLGPIYELKIMDFLESWAVVKLLSSYRKLSMSGSDWHTRKQIVYNWTSNKSEMRQHHDRLASSRPSHAIRKSRCKPSIKNGRGACRFQWRVGPSYREYSGVTYDLLVSNMGGTYDLTDQLPSNHEFGHFLVVSQSQVPQESGVNLAWGSG